MVKDGIEPEYATVLAKLDTAVKNGEEKRMNNVVQDITGRVPTSIKRFIEVAAENGVWDPTAVETHK
jgi:festuclavine dehydrogenase